MSRDIEANVQQMSRRDAIKKLGAVVGTVSVPPLLAWVLSGCGPAEPARSIATVVAGWHDTPYGKFVVITDAQEMAIVNEPHPVKVKFIAPKRGFERAETKGKVLISRQPTLEGEVNADALLPSQIQTEYAVRVFGGKYTNPNSPWDDKTVIYKGEEREGGLWFALSDEGGNLISPWGTKLGNNEKPFYISGNSVDLVTEVGPITLGEAAALEVKGVYKGIVFVTKRIDGDDALNVRSDPHTMDKLGTPRTDNIVSWDQIVSLVGTDITDINTFSVLNPLVADGDNPNFDKGRHPSVWLAFMGEVIVNKNPLTTRRVQLFINLSEQTTRPKYVQPDSLSWVLNIVGVQVTGDSILPEDPAQRMPALKDLSVVRRPPAAGATSGK